MRCSENYPRRFVSVQVEIRMWRTNGSVVGTRPRPVTVPAVLVCDDGRNPVLAVQDNDGEIFFYLPEEARAEGFGSVLVLFVPSSEQTRTLAAAAERGYPIEPRVAGEPFLTIEDL